MSRYRARSGSALSAISLGIMIAVIICAVAIARYANVFDYVGPNMASNAINVYTPPSGAARVAGAVGPQVQPAPAAAEPVGAGGHRARDRLRRRRQARRRARQPGRDLQNPSADGRQWDGPIYVATPALLRAYGINPSSIPSNVDILSSRPGLAGSGVQLTFGGGGKGGDGFQGLGAAAAAATTSARPTSAWPTRSYRRRANCPRARRRRTR